MTTNTEMTPDEIENALAGYYGSETWYKYLMGMTLTEGAKAVADLCGAYWLHDLIASYQPQIRKGKNTRLKEFQIWTLRHAPTEKCPNQAVAECFADSGEKPVISQTIEYTSFPKISAHSESFPNAAIMLYVENNVIYLPSER